MQVLIILITEYNNYHGWKNTQIIPPLPKGINKLSSIWSGSNSISVAVITAVILCGSGRLEKNNEIANDEIKKAAVPSHDLLKILCLPNRLPKRAAQASEIIKKRRLNRAYGFGNNQIVIIAPTNR